MGCYETLPGGQQVKCWWRELRHICFGDEVPDVHENHSYCIALREGGFATIDDNHLVAIDALPRNGIPLFDKYGDVWTGNNKGILGEGYFMSCMDLWG